MNRTSDPDLTHAYHESLGALASGDEDEGSYRWLPPGELLAFPVPTAALQLDAQLRHLQIDGEFADWGAAAGRLAHARVTWKRLRPAVGARAAARADIAGAGTIVQEMDRALESARTAVRAMRSRTLVKAARRAIELVDVVERIFE